MKAVIQREYGPPDVLRRADLDLPAVVGPDEVRIRVYAAGVDPGVWFFLTGRPWLVRAAAGIRAPRHTVPGRALAGRVEAVGAQVTHFRAGEDVYAEGLGAFAEYAVVAERMLARKPANLTFEQAAAIPISATTALQGLRDTGRLRAGQHVLVNGATGGVGTFAVQIAKALGAEVTAVCAPNAAELVRSLGADHVVDYTREDFTAGTRRYDVVFDLVGSHSLAQCRRVLTPDGRLVLSAGPPAPWLRRRLAALVLSPLRSRTMAALDARPNAADLDALRDLVEAGQVTPVIDRVFPLEDVVDALRHYGSGHARGKTVLSIR
ncbi:NAD(P)-dependent alcohol dehydrogenase [Micromonospora carbonacea]|nr:NAD(P)-dependent alcohol dehydrogenase [Micromonospora carbonacea]